MVHRTSCRLVAGAVLLALAGLGCTDEKIVFREPVNPPPDANSGFLGYFTATDKQTTCGNCHVAISGPGRTRPMPAPMKRWPRPVPPSRSAIRATR